MGVFDQHARLACKLDGVGFHAWLLSRRGNGVPLRFDHWGDARRLAVVPGLERVDDLVAVLHSTDQSAQQVHFITEVEVEPRRHQLKRLGIYALLLSIEVSSAAQPEDEPPVGVCLLNLTGKRKPNKVTLTVPGSLSEFLSQPYLVNLEEEDAGRTLDEIQAGRIARCILVWIPLMAGGGDPERIDQWKAVAAAEPDPELRAIYAWYALVFAELTRSLVNWQQALKGWEMKESQLVNEVKREGALEGQLKAQRTDLLKVIRVRLANPVPEPIRLAVEGTNDPETLSRWFDLALTKSSIREFAGAMVSPE